MATTRRQVRKAAESNILSQSGDMNQCGNFLTFEDREALASKPECTSCRATECTPFILPRTGSISRGRSPRALGLPSILIDVAAYVTVGGIAIYAVAISSIPALMSAIIATGLYIVFSYYHQGAVGVRQEVENRNYIDLISPWINRN